MVVLLDAINVIINADDLGSSQEINQAVFDLIQSGKVTSATLIANAPYLDEACQLAENYPLCSFGAHLNLTQFSPISGSKGLGQLLNDDGEFTYDPIREVSVDSALSDAIFGEFCAQIQKLQASGVAVSHIDSHHNIHCMPSIFRVLKRVQKRFQIRRVRLSRNIYGLSEKVSPLLRIQKTAYNFLLRHYYRTQTTQGFTDFQTFYEAVISGRLDFHSVEAMTHPGSKIYADESGILQTPWRENLGIPVRLISYHDISLPLR